MFYTIDRSFWVHVTWAFFSWKFTCEASLPSQMLAKNCSRMYRRASRGEYKSLYCLASRGIGESGRLRVVSSGTVSKESPSSLPACDMSPFGSERWSYACICGFVCSRQFTGHHVMSWTHVIKERHVRWDNTATTDVLFSCAGQRRSRTHRDTWLQMRGERAA
jgi:hypothetical protein